MGLVLLVGIGVLVVAGVIRSRFNSTKKIIPPPRFDIGTLVRTTSVQNIPYEARIATRNWHYAEQSHFYVLEGKSKIYLENELSAVLVDSPERNDDDAKPDDKDFDAKTAMRELQSESLRSVASIQDHNTIEPHYFDRYRKVVERTVVFFQSERTVPNSLLQELQMSARIIRNEAYAFQGRTSACLEMADWLEAQANKISLDKPTI